jgi:predicted nucleic acid-binding protein
VKIVVQDASVLIDLAVGDCLTAWFSTGIETHTTRPVLQEVEQDVSQFVRARQLQVFDFEGAELVQLLAFKSRQSPGLSFEDCSVFYLAEKLEAILLTGDKLLRSVAIASHREVHGTLWILDILVERQILSTAKAATALMCIRERNTRLPKVECAERLNRWKKIRP